MRVLAAVLVILGICSKVAFPAEMMEGTLLFPAKNGNVVFPHQAHVELVKDKCTVCHKSPGPIDGFGREYAHDVCIGCHQPEGDDKGGPITCEGCHGNPRG